MKKETWKALDFLGFPHYAVSDQGRVKRQGGKILKQQYTRHGYLQVSIYNRDKQVRHFRVNRLVAMAFILNQRKNPTDEVHHKNFCKQDNRASNLIWLSHKDNCRESMPGRTVYQYSMNGKLLNVYKYIKEAACVVDCSSPTIARHCINRKPYGGFIWRYEQIEDNNKLNDNNMMNEETLIRISDGVSDLANSIGGITDVKTIYNMIIDFSNTSGLREQIEAYSSSGCVNDSLSSSFVNIAQASNIAFEIKERDLDNTSLNKLLTVLEMNLRMAHCNFIVYRFLTYGKFDE